MKHYDVAIIGAGPAGSSAAISLTRFGYSVALVDKKVFPRDKLCGDFVSPINMPLFCALGIEQQVLSQPHEQIRAFRMTSYLGGDAAVSLPRSHGQRLFGLGLSRACLDELLLCKARIDGVSDFQGFRVQRLERLANGWCLRLESAAALKELSAAILIGADGRNSWVAHRLRLGGKSPSGRRVVGFQMRLKCPDRPRESVDIHLFPSGYAGVVGIGDDVLNLCLAIEKDRLPAQHRIEYLLRSCLPENRWLKAILERSSLVGEVRSVYPVYFPPRRCYSDGALLVGDAARVNEPVTGEGIYFALKSGMIAAKTIDMALRKGDLSAAQLSSQARECGRAFRIRRGVNLVIRRLIYRPALLAPLIGCAYRQRQILTPLVHAICTPSAEL
jgi:flavin-dependent dehydrogenase